MLPMKITLFIPTLAGGGMQRSTLRLAGGLVESGHMVDVVTIRSGGDYPVPDGVRRVDLGASRALTSIPALVGYLRRERPDYLYAVSENANLIALWARALARTRTPVAVSIRTVMSRFAATPDIWRERFYPQLARWFYPQADAVVAVSNAVRDDVASILGLPPDRIDVMYNPVVTPDLLVQAEEPVAHPWFQQDQPPVILGVGRLIRDKGFDTLIRAFALVQRRVRLVILGDGDSRIQLMRLVQELDVNADVDLPGFAENPFAYMAKSAVVVLPSRYEGFGNVLVEAMACGTPVVSTNYSGGPREILRDGELGPLVPVDDPEALAAAIIDVLDHPPDRERLRQRAWDFNLEAAVRRFEDVLGLSQ